MINTTVTGLPSMSTIVLSTSSNQKYNNQPVYDKNQYISPKWILSRSNNHSLVQTIKNTTENL